MEDRGDSFPLITTVFPAYYRLLSPFIAFYRLLSLTAKKNNSCAYVYAVPSGTPADSLFGNRRSSFLRPNNSVQNLLTTDAHGCTRMKSGNETFTMPHDAVNPVAGRNDL
jgi:hypothetical protein